MAARRRTAAAVSEKTEKSAPKKKTVRKRKVSTASKADAPQSTTRRVRKPRAAATSPTITEELEFTPAAPDAATPTNGNGHANGNGSFLPYEDVAKEAYFIWQERGCPSGMSEQHWFEAESRLRLRA